MIVKRDRLRCEFGQWWWMLLFGASLLGTAVDPLRVMGDDAYTFTEFESGQYELVEGDWKVVEGDARWDLIRVIRDQCATNLSRIRTWKGTYRVKSKEGTRGVETTKTGPRNFSRIPLDHISVVTFALDVPSGRTNRDFQVESFRFVDAVTGAEVKIDGRSISGERSIVTPTEYLQFDPEFRPELTGYLPNHPEARNKRIVSRWDPVRANGHYSKLLSPLSFFGIVDGEGVAAQINDWLRFHEGLDGERAKQMINARMTVCESIGAGPKSYRIDHRYPRGGGDLPPKDVPCPNFTFLFEERYGLHPTLYYFRDEKGRDQKRLRWRWRKERDVFLPEAIEELFDYRDPEHPNMLALHRESVLTESTLNEPIPHEQFSIAALGTEEGDLVVDRQTHTVQIIKQGTLELLGMFGDTRALADDKSSPFAPSFFVGLNLAVAAVIGAVLVVRRMRRRSQARVG